MKLVNISITDLHSNKHNPRSFTRDQDLDDLAKSIEAHGIIEPLIVRSIVVDGQKAYEVIAGHRRLMAADGLLDHLPCVVRDMDASDDGTVLALVENTQRVDLTPYEQAKAIASALAGGMKQKDLAAAIGRSQTHVSKFVKIMKAAKAIGARGDSADYFDDYTSYEELYEHARDVLGEIKHDPAPPKKKQSDIESVTKKGGLTDGSEDALKSLILGHAEVANVKCVSAPFVTTMETNMENLSKGNLCVTTYFKNTKDAEKFFSAYQVSTPK